MINVFVSFVILFLCLCIELIKINLVKCWFVILCLFNILGMMLIVLLL